MMNNALKISHINLMKLWKSNSPKKLDDKKKEENKVTCFKCGKFEHYKNNCPRVMKHNVK